MTNFESFWNKREAGIRVPGYKTTLNWFITWYLPLLRNTHASPRHVPRDGKTMDECRLGTDEGFSFYTSILTNLLRIVLYGNYTPRI
ncbi:hypothetical protein [Sporosarcina sp. FSL K6-1508]|uniref:hypothetical protein n=1 Tax=Sporosarcina sp. FSL K6-1508 TaxID=2921553 RepID=UPI0030F630D8